MNAVYAPRGALAGQLGVSLIEILVSLVIGIFVVGAVLTNYISTGVAGAQQGAASQMTEDAQIGFAIMSRDIQMAGYTDASSIVATPGGGTATFARLSITRPIKGCDFPFVTATAAFAAATCATTGGTDTHSIELNFQATTLTSSVNASGTPTDCLGNAVTATADPTFGNVWLNSNRYFVTTTTATGRPELHCASQASAGSGAQPLVENIQSMKIWYGIAPGWNVNSPASRQPSRYVTASQLAGVPATDNDIVSVRLCLLVQSAQPVLSDGDPNTYLDCDLNSQTSTDRRLRRAFFSTVALRNKMGF